MSIVLIRQDGKLEAWTDALRAFAPQIPIYRYDQPHDTEDIRMAIVWKHPSGSLSAYNNLEAIASFGAGVDFILDDPELPPGIPVCRVVDPFLSSDMAEFVLARILEHLKGFRQMHRDAREKSWNPFPYKRLHEIRVGILGYGELGSTLGRLLNGLNCSVKGWTRNPKANADIPIYHGDEGLEPFLGQTDILVCLLPLTPETTGILTLDLFAKLPKGSFLINVARGGHLVENDLLTAIDRGYLSGAALDVFEQEPLPPVHPFWQRKEIAISPHVASVSDIAAVVPQLISNYERLRKGVPLENKVSRTLGY